VSAPVLHLLAGPNGSGKSTFVARVLQPITHLPFINADVMAAERWPGAESDHAYDASAAAATARDAAMSTRRSFITETVFSHPSKLDLVRRAAATGYIVVLHVMMVPVEVTVLRVDHRVTQGGHSVPETKIRERYDRLWSLVAQARSFASRTVFYDNSLARTPFRVVADYRRGRLIGEASWPKWAPAALTGNGSAPRR
jgi:predicted ABC-type ATPase